MTLAAQLAQRINRISWEKLPPQVVANAKSAILDTVGVMLAGSHDEPTTRLLRVPGMRDAGPCLVLGHAIRTSALNAALVNGTSAHAMDFDDVNIALGGHPSAPLVPALFALVEITEASGRDVITSFVTGFETTTRIARGVNYHHYEKGWHPTVTLGIFGVAAACARLLKLSDSQMATALSIGASFASGVKANFGTMTKPLHVGHCARNGLFAALLAQENCTASSEAFEDKQGFLNVFNGPGTFDCERMLAAWSQPFDIDQPGLGIKLYPCCGSTHAAIDGMITLATQHGIRPDDIERIDARIHARRLAHINRPDPKSALDAKFSVQYCLARALLERAVVVDHFENDAFLDVRARALTQKVHVEGYRNPAPDVGDHYAVDLSVTLKSGARITIRQERPCGRTPEDPTPPERLKAKFENCAARVLGSAKAPRLYAALDELEKMSSLRELIADEALRV
jgi:2-methylcitrate dehydratase PrpD